MALGLSRPARSLALTLPLVAFLGVTFVAPLGVMLWRSVHEPDVAGALPATLARLAEWDGVSTPSEAVFEAAGREMRVLREVRALGNVAMEVNRVVGGTRSTIMRTARRLSDVPADGMWRATMIGINPDWREPEIWGAIRRAGEAYTARHYLHALDLDQNVHGDVVLIPQDRRIYIELLGRTLLASAGITLLCILLGYPVAFVMANSRPLWSNIVLTMVLVPFTTSLIARSVAWLILLQKEGVVNDLLVGTGIIEDDGRASMVYNLGGTMVAMTHALLPFFVLPLYSVMQTIPRHYLRTASSLGASPWQAFGQVYWRLSLPGVGAGALLVFILAIGQYIAPGIIGGRTGAFISNLIAYHMQTSLNWGLAAALNFVLLACVLVVYLFYDRLFGIERLRLDP